MAVGTLYHYFANKEAIVNELYRRMRRDIEKAVYLDLPAGIPPSEQFRVLWQRFVAFAMAKPLAFRFLEMHHHDAYLDAASHDCDRQVASGTQATLQLGRLSGILKPIHDEVLAAFVDGADGCDCRGTVAIASWGFQAQGKVWFTTADVARFHSQLMACHQALDGAATFTTHEENLRLEVIFSRRGRVDIQGTFRETQNAGNELKFRIQSMTATRPRKQELKRLAKEVKTDAGVLITLGLHCDQALQQLQPGGEGTSALHRPLTPPV